MYKEGRYRWFPFGYDQPDQGIYFIYWYQGFWTTDVEIEGTSKEIPACRVRVEWLPGVFLPI